MTQQAHGAEQTPSDRARHAVEQACGEPARVLRLGYVDLRYQVPDRTRHGDRKDEFGWFLRVLFGIAGIAGGFAALFAGLFDPFGLFGRKSRVSGPEACAALPLADAVKQAKELLCLVWSANHLALVETGLRAPARIVWQARRGEFATFDPSTGVVSWSDGSRLTFSIPRHERKRAAQDNGQL